MPTQGAPICVGRRRRSRRHPAAGPAAANSAATSTDIAPCQGYGQAATSHAAAPCKENQAAGAEPVRMYTSVVSRILGIALGPSGVAGTCAAGRMHFMLGEILAATLIIVPLTASVILVAVIVFGGTESSNRVFRLLRCIRDKEEPPAPGGPCDKSRPADHDAIRPRSRQPGPARHLNRRRLRSGRWRVICPAHWTAPPGSNSPGRSRSHGVVVTHGHARTNANRRSGRVAGRDLRNPGRA